MNNRLKATLSVGALAAILPLVTGLSLVAAADTTESRSVPLEGATRAEVHVDLDAGRLEIAGATFASASGTGTPTADGDLLQGEFTVSDEDWLPDLEYKVTGDTGVLEIEQDAMDDLDFDDVEDFIQGESHNSWDLTLNNAVPIDLEVDLDAGEADLALSGMTLTNLDVDIEAGDATVDLTGDWTQSFDAHVDAEGGQVTLKLPKDVGVRVHADTDLGDVDTEGLTEEGDDYVNDAYGESPITITVNVDASVGQIVLEVED